MRYQVYNPDNVAFHAGLALPNGQRLELHIAPRGFCVVDDYGEFVNKAFAHLEVGLVSDERARGIVAAHNEYLQTVQVAANSRAKYLKKQAVLDAKKAVAVEKRLLAERQAVEKAEQKRYRDLVASERPALAGNRPKRSSKKARKGAKK